MNVLCAEDSQDVLRDSPNPILVYGAAGFLKYTNPAFEILSGFKANEIIGMKPPFPWWPEDDALYKMAFEISLTKGSVYKAIKFKTKEGTCFYVDINTSPLNGNQQAVQNWFDVTNDIIARQQIQNLIRNATMRMAQV